MKTVLKTYGPALLSGVTLALAFPTWSLYPLAWVALIPLFVSAAKAPPRRAAFLFLLSGWAFNAILLQWLMTNVYWAGGWAFWGYQGLCIVLALFWALMAWGWASWIRGRFPRGANAVSLALLWGVMEYLQARLFTGFGWGAIAYSQGKDLLVAQWAAVGTTLLVSVIVVLVNALLAEAILLKGRARVFSVVAACAVAALAHGGGALLLGQPDYASKPLNVGILQPDFPLEMKWDQEYSVEMVRNAAEKSRILAQHRKVDLFVWPESLIMDDIHEPDIWNIVTDLTKTTGAPLFTGSQRYDEKTRTDRNSSFLITPEGKIVDYYDKVHLAPFGEYVPFAEYFPFIGKIIPAIGDVRRGEGLKTMPAGERTFGPLICFEVLFADLAGELLTKGADFLVVITNLGWFGASNAIPQEFELARMRAIETRLPVVHNGNTGISGVFDPWGRFAPVRGIVGTDKSYYEFTGDLPNEATIMRRVVGALPVAAPHDDSPLVKWTSIAICLGTALALALLPMRRLEP